MPPRSYKRDHRAGIAKGVPGLDLYSHSFRSAAPMKVVRTSSQLPIAQQLDGAAG